MSGIFDWTKDTPIDTAVLQALAAATMTWENPLRAGKVNISTLEAIAKELVDFIVSEPAEAFRPFARPPIVFDE